MKFCRFEIDGNPHWGMAVGDEITQLSAPPFDGVKATDQVYGIGAVRLLAPCLPPKIICIGLNYKDHIAEFGRTEIPTEPVFFLKAPSAVIGPDEAIVIPHEVGRVDYEGELALVIGKTGRHIKPAEVPSYIFGLTCLNDVTARSLQKKDVQWTRSKSFDTFAPIGPMIATGIEYDDLSIETRLNGKIVQSSRTSHMIFSIQKLIVHVSSVMTLYPGDIIATGTPMGVGAVNAGDTVEIQIEGVGTLHNPVVNER